MKSKPRKKASALRQSNEVEIRLYAQHLFEQTGCVPGRDLDHWLEAKACLEAGIAAEYSHMRLYRYLQREARPDVMVEMATEEAPLLEGTGNLY
jgi:hypothetical protein